ncbi:MAG TPA: hypothetical protein VF808_01850 [Ktedonobacterales bacterium]
MIVVVAGRRIDPENAPYTRFPVNARAAVGMRIKSALRDLKVTTLVASAACGADLLALDAARALGARRRVILPYQEDWFLTDSVTDRPGDWKELFEGLIADARDTHDLIILGQARGSDEAYIAANDAIIAEGLRLADAENPASPGDALAGLIVWEGAPRGPDDVTEHMRQRLQGASGQIVTVRTTLTNGA